MMLTPEEILAIQELIDYADRSESTIFVRVNVEANLAKILRNNAKKLLSMAARSHELEAKLATVESALLASEERFVNENMSRYKLEKVIEEAEEGLTKLSHSGSGSEWVDKKAQYTLLRMKKIRDEKL